jgi:uncharacterized repeat protein (TIGR01451 family)
MNKTITSSKMKTSRHLIVCIVALLFVNVSKNFAQGYYTIPDTNFAAWLNANIPAAMSGNMMDTTHAAVLSRMRIDVEDRGITNLDGVQYFTSLVTLDCGNPPLETNPNILTSLPALPNSLDTLVCGKVHNLASLPTLPDSLVFLKCYNNQLTSLPALPVTLTYLDCSNNLLTALPTLPANLSELRCDINQLTVLPVLPSALTVLYCTDNSLTGLPTLPNGFNTLYCGANQITALPVLPGSLIYLQCTNNQIDSLPQLPASIIQLRCNINLLTSLPALPTGLNVLECNGNQLTSLPQLPGTLTALYCQNNNISCFPVFPQINDTNYFNIANNPFNCLPNYIPAMASGLLSYPLCLPGNSNGCVVQQGIVGFVYKDANANCDLDSLDNGLVNIPIKIYDSSNQLLGQTYTALNGVYNFLDTMGLGYTVVVDTMGSPYTTQCSVPGLDSTIIAAGIDSNVNFPLTCKTGIDVGVRSAVTNGIVFPGQQHTLQVNAGDMTQWYNLNCANGTSGTVQISVYGPVTYAGPAFGALTPTVAGNVYTYAISDFGTINNKTAFGLLFNVDTTAQSGDMICSATNVSPGTDNDITNNNYQYCYPVVNSHDPNKKEVYPADVPPGYTDWLTYTVHFQNTGSAPAFNIRISDTLDSNLDLSTFQVLNYSHTVSSFLNGNVLTCRFANINLPDSTSNLAGSSGYIQYRIKPKANLTSGTQIHNTAYIYFDYNAAVVTNTTENNYVTTTSAKTTTKVKDKISVYPNPFSDNVTFAISTDASTMFSFELIDILGKKVLSQQNITAKQFQINRNGLESGIYFYKICNEAGVIGTGKVIVK